MGRNMKPQVDIFLDEGEGRNDTSIEFYIDPNHVFSISIDPSGTIDAAALSIAVQQMPDIGRPESVKSSAEIVDRLLKRMR